MTFRLDPRLAADTVLVRQMQLCELRLINDSRWPWLILVPRRDDIAEIFDLDTVDESLLHDETRLAATALKRLTGCTKINIAAIGNVVRQLHVHVIARHEGDANWPGPVWGFGQKVPYSAQDLDAISARVAEVVS